LADSPPVTHFVTVLAAFTPHSFPLHFPTPPQFLLVVPTIFQLPLPHRGIEFSDDTTGYTALPLRLTIRHLPVLEFELPITLLSLTFHSRRPALFLPDIPPTISCDHRAILCYHYVTGFRCSTTAVLHCVVPPFIPTYQYDSTYRPTSTVTTHLEFWKELHTRPDFPIHLFTHFPMCSATVPTSTISICIPGGLFLIRYIGATLFRYFSTMFGLPAGYRRSYSSTHTIY